MNITTTIRKEELSHSVEAAKSVQIPNRSDILKVNSILQAIQPLEKKLKYLIDSFEISRQAFSTFINDVNVIR